MPVGRSQHMTNLPTLWNRHVIYFSDAFIDKIFGRSKAYLLLQITNNNYSTSLEKSAGNQRTSEMITNAYVVRNNMLFFYVIVMSNTGLHYLQSSSGFEAQIISFIYNIQSWLTFSFQFFYKKFVLGVK